MALLPVNSSELPTAAALAAALEEVHPTAPIVVMIHGFKFSPDAPGHCPHGHILSMAPRTACWKAVSWPRHLGLRDREGLGIAFGWPARGSIWAAYRQSRIAGRALGQLLRRVQDLAPGRPVHIVAHSLGARVALNALPGLAAGTVGRMILISPAVFRTEAERLMAAPAGRAAEVVNILGRENTAFDLMLRAVLPVSGPTLGRGGPRLANWLDIRLDRHDSLAALRGLGYRVVPPRARICHWSGYLRPGVFSLYRALLHRPAETPIAVLRRALTPERSHRRGRIAALSGFALRPQRPS